MLFNGSETLKNVPRRGEDLNRPHLIHDRLGAHESAPKPAISKTVSAGYNRNQQKTGAIKTTHLACIAVLRRSLKAKFHYTGPTGPDQTRADQHGPARTLSETRSDGSGRTRVMEFS